MITITLDANEQTAFVQILDAALRHMGAGALDAAAHFKAKLLAAADAAKTESKDS